MKSYIEEAWEKIFGTKRTRRIFIAATRQNIGKTTVSLGLIATLRSRFKDVAFIKPIGQRYMMEKGHKVDEDSVLIDRIFKFDLPLQDMSPIAISRGYTEKFLDGEVRTDAPARIKRAFARVSDGKDLVVIEGTGHAGVGSVFDLSNAPVAKMFDSKVILVAPGGIGNPIDEVMLNKSLFDKKGVELAGVIVNKVHPHKYDKVNSYVSKGLNRLGIPVLGVLPYMDLLDIPTLQDFREELDMHVLCGGEYLGRQTKKVLVGAMEVKEAERYLEDDCLVITPGHRMDLINLIIKVHTGHFRAPKRIAGLVLSGGQTPKRRVYNALKRTDIPTLLSRFNTYDVAAKIHDLTVKIKSRDRNKVEMAIDMIEKYVDVERVIRNLG